MTCIAQLLEEAGDALIDDDDEVTLRQRVESAGYYLRKVGRHICDWTPNDDLESQIESKVDDDDSRLTMLDNYDFDDMSSDIYSLRERVDALEEEKETLEENLEALKGDHEKLFNEVQILYGMLHEQKALIFSTGHAPGPRSEIRFVCENNAFIPEDMSK